MGRFLAFVNMLGIFFLAIMSLAFNNYSVNARNEMKNLHLTYAIDLAVDAATDQLLSTPDLGLDYGDEGRIDLDPQAALDVFVDTFLLNYNLSTSNQNREWVKANFMPVFLVATYDGYYLATMETVSSDVNAPENTPVNVDQKMIFYPKMPYKYVDAGVSYALNFGAKDYLRMAGANLTKGTGFPPGLLSQEEVLAEINKIISTDVAYRIEELNEANPNYANAFFIPTGLTKLNGSNLLAGPSVMALVQNVQVNTVKPISGFSIGGGKVAAARYILGYTRVGVQYYAYADQVPAASIVEGVFASPEDAALAGYFPDLLYYQN